MEKAKQEKSILKVHEIVKVEKGRRNEYLEASEAGPPRGKEGREVRLIREEKVREKRSGDEDGGKRVGG
jgi:hypothetical protein